MQDQDSRMKITVCVMITFLSVLFLYLFTDYQVFVMNDTVTEYLESVIEKVDEDVYDGISPSELNQDRNVYRHQFLKEISEEISGKGIYYYGDTYGMSNTGDLGLSDVAHNVYKKIDWSNARFDKYEISVIQSFWSWKERRIVFVYYPFWMVMKKYFFFYLVFIVCVIFLERFILSLKTRHGRRGRFKALMSSTLITGFSHELKTPLAILKASVENWNYIDETDRPEYLERVSSEVNHLDGIVHKLVGISDLGSGRIKLNKQPVDLYLLVQEVYEQQKPVIDERKLSVRITADRPENCIIIGDREMLRIAVGNFISNAVKYSAREITIELTSGRRVALRVTNDGAAIDKKESRNVWKLFYKNDASRTDRFGSSGVGLAVTRNILRTHKAKFGCTSGDDRTTFWFEMNQCKTGKED